MLVLFEGYTGRLNDEMVDQFLKDLLDKSREVLDDAKKRRVCIFFFLTFLPRLCRQAFRAIAKALPSFIVLISFCNYCTVKKIAGRV